MPLIPSQRALFSLPRDVAYLNCAYMSPLLNAVAAAGQQAAALKAQPWTIGASDFFATPERVRRLFAELIGAGADDIAIVPSCSYGIAAAAANLTVAKGQTLVVLNEQFPSNVYSWRELANASGGRVVTVPRGDGPWTPRILEAIDGDTAVVALAHCHWTDGGLVDLVAVGRRCRTVGAALVVDLTQSIGALPFDVTEVEPDFVVAAGYKWMMGPYSLGFLYVAPKWHGGRPIEHNWIARAGSEDFAGLVNYRTEFRPGARRFDVGESANFVLMPMAAAALEQLHAWEVPRIAATLSAQTDEIARRAAELGFVASAPSHRAGHFLGLRFPKGLPEGLANRLAAEKVYVSVRGDALRITPHLYNDGRDVDRLIAMLQAML